jgi:hypothetical protein
MKVFVLDRHHIYNEYDTTDTKLYWFLKKTGMQRIGHNFNDTYWSFRHRGSLLYYEERVEVDFVIYTEEWKVLPKTELYKIYNDFLEYFDRKKLMSWPQSWTVGCKNFRGFRNGPVPHTHKRSSGSCYRQPRTNQERRTACRDKEYVRKSRNKTNLPTNYDDVRRSDSFVKRSWKKIKKRKQWMSNNK